MGWGRQARWKVCSRLVGPQPSRIPQGGAGKQAAQSPLLLAHFPGGEGPWDVYLWKFEFVLEGLICFPSWLQSPRLIPRAEITGKYHNALAVLYFWF